MRRGAKGCIRDAALTSPVIKAPRATGVPLQNRNNRIAASIVRIDIVGNKPGFKFSWIAYGLRRSA